MLAAVLLSCASGPFAVSSAELNCPMVEPDAAATPGVVALGLNDGGGVLWLTPPPMASGESAEVTFGAGAVAVPADGGTEVSMDDSSLVAWGREYRAACVTPPAAPIPASVPAARWAPVGGSAHWTSMSLSWTREEEAQDELVYALVGVADVSLVDVEWKNLDDGDLRLTEDWTGTVAVDGSYFLGDHGAGACQSDCW
jgi:hypothetical protein